VFEKRVLRIIFGTKGEEMGRTCSTHGEEDECIQDFGGKAKRKETTRKIEM
jgi:hypothetical protein